MMLNTVLCFLILQVIVVVVTATRSTTTTSSTLSSSRNSRRTTFSFGLSRQIGSKHHTVAFSSSTLPPLSIRGGSISATAAIEEEDSDEDVDEDDQMKEEEEKTEEYSSTVDAASTTNISETISDDNDDDDDKNHDDNGGDSINKAVDLLFKTNLNNPIVDFSKELTSKRSRTFQQVKENLARSIPGKPPVIAIELIYKGRVLTNDMLVDEIFEEEDDDEDEEDDEGEVEEKDESQNEKRTLILNIIPPVEERFIVDLVPKILSNDELNDLVTDIDESKVVSTEELLDAYFLNQAFQMYNTQFMMSTTNKDETNITPASPTLLFEIQEQAKQWKQDLQSQVPTDKWEDSMKPIVKVDKSDDTTATEEWKGQRYRSGKGGLIVQVKKTIQTNFNVDWGEAIWTFLLFLFFGYFGGKSALSRSLLIFGAPLSILIQTRYLKVWLKTAFYMCMDPPFVFLSLLPAPEQRILQSDLSDAFDILYGNAAKKMQGKTLSGRTVGSTMSVVDEEESEVEEDDDSEDDDDDVDADDDDEYDSEEEEEDGDE